MDIAIQKNIIEKAGAFLKYKGETIAQGRENAKELLRKDPALMKEIEHQVRVAAKLDTDDSVANEGDDNAVEGGAAEVAAN